MERPHSYDNAVSRLGFVRALSLRMRHLNAELDDLHRLAQYIEGLLAAGSGEPNSSPLSPFVVRAATVVMGCATLEGFLVDIAKESSCIEHHAPFSKKPNTSILDSVRIHFQTVAHLSFPADSPAWRHTKAISQLRNSLVHTLGHVESESQRSSIAMLPGVTLSPQGDIWLETTAPTSIIQVLRQVAQDVEASLGGPQQGVGDPPSR